MKLCVIPARGGSKRIPRKNIKHFLGYPMIRYAITAAQNSETFDRIIVSTDDKEIAQIANTYGAETPFSRPENIAGDHATTVEVVAHAISHMENTGFFPSLVCCVYPAVPMIRVQDIAKALGLLEAGGCSGYCYPVAEYPSAVQRAFKLGAVGRLTPVDEAHHETRTQDLEPRFYDAGQFYWASRDTWIKKQSIHKNGIGLLLPPHRVVDIDTEADWKWAEVIFEALHSRNEL